MTSTPPRGFTAAAQAAISVPLGPPNVIASVASGAQDVSLPSPPCPCPWPPPPLFLPALCAAASAASIAEAAVAPTPSSPSLRIASRRVMIPST